MRLATKPISLESLIRGERLADELTPHEAAAMMTALAGVQLALANRILTAKPPQEVDRAASELELVGSVPVTEPQDRSR
jgi:hypothetical protein